MKKIDRKGFTLIELLAVIIILGVLLLIAVPAVSKYVQQSKEDTYVTNIGNFVSAVQTGVAAGDYAIGLSKYKVIKFSEVSLDRGSNTKSPFGAYTDDKSFVVVRNNAGVYEYYVAAADASGYGFGLTAADSVSVDNLKDPNDESTTNIGSNSILTGYTEVS